MGITGNLTIRNKKISFAACLWFLLALIAVIIQLHKGSFNNYLIFKGVFYHTINQLNLYAEYPAEYGDTNHYGPFFSLIIAPFAWLPNGVGCFFWVMANAAFLFFAVRQLPVNYKNQNIILLAGAVEMMTAMHNVQFNPMLTSWIVLSYVLVYKQKDFWATLFIAAGILTKLYGITGLVFFLFSEHKRIFIISFLFWMAALFCLPMLLSSPAFIIQSYKDWYTSLMYKNETNQESVMQGMTVMRLIKKILLVRNLPDVYVLGTAAVLYLIPMLRFHQYKKINFQLSYLSFLLIGVVIYSSSAESSTYVIAMTGVGIWYIIQNEKNYGTVILLGLAVLLTSLSATDLFPKAIKENFIRPYAIKALPCFLIWLVLAYQLLFKKFSMGNTSHDEGSIRHHSAVHLSK